MGNLDSAVTKYWEKKIVIRLSFFTDTTLEEIVSCEKFHVS